MIPLPYAAEAGGNRIVQLDTGHQDAGEPLEFVVESAAVAPAGVSGDCAFDRLRIVLTWSAACSLTVTPVLDGVELVESAHGIVLAAGATPAARQSKSYELVLRRVSASGSTYALRGTWLAVRIEGTVESAGDVILDPSVLEYEVLTPTQERA